MPFAWLELINLSFLQFAGSQRVMIAGIVSMAAGALTHGIFVAVLVYGLDMGFTGICWATGMVFVGRTLAT